MNMYFKLYIYIYRGGGVRRATGYKKKKKTAMHWILEFSGVA